MASSIRLGSFEFQVRVVLVLLVLLLAVLNLVNLWLLRRAELSLRAVQLDGSRHRIERLVAEVGPAELVAGRGVTASGLRKLALRFGYDRIAILDAVGDERRASGPGRTWATRLGDLEPDAREALRGGSPISGPMVPRSGGSDARVTSFFPLFDDGRLEAVVAAVEPVPELGALHRRFRMTLAVQIVGVLVIGACALLFANWVSRPYRRLAAAADEAGLAAAADPDGGPDELVDAVRGIVGRLKAQDETIVAFERGGGSLGDLVRFAARSARRLETGVLVVDRRGRVAAMNPAVATLLGCDAERAEGLRLDRVAGRVEGLRGRVRRCLEGGASFSREVLAAQADDGTTHHLGVSVSPATGFGERVSGALVLMTDLTEIRKLQEQARLQESLAQVGRLSAGIAHEFRNALATILGYAKMLVKRDDPAVRAPAREILKEVDSVRAIVDEFLLFARPPEPAPEPVRIDALVRRCAAAVDGLQLEVEGRFGEALADEGLLRRAVENLLRNAREAAPDRAERTRVRVTGRTDPATGQLEVDVEDDGPGIPEAIRDQIFDPFFTTRRNGTGLGLALVQRVLVEMGGSVELRQGELGGALFRIRLPLARRAGAVARQL